MTAALLTIPQLAAAAADGADPRSNSVILELMDRAYTAIHDKDTDLALESLRNALLQAEDRTLIRLIAMQTGYLLAGINRPKAATAMFQRAADITEDAEVLKALGYAAKAAGHDDVALDAFQGLLDLAPADSAIHLEAAYLLKAAGARAQAAQHFRRAMELSDPHPQQDMLRREVHYMENAVDGGVSILWRARSRPQGDRDLSLGAQVLSQSQGLADISLPLAWPRPFGRASLFGRMIWAIDDADPTPARDSLQGGVGLKIRPFAATNLVLSGERLIAIEDNARDDWLVRLAWSGGGTLGAAEAETGGWDWSLYGDAAVIGVDETDLQLLGEGRIAYRWTLGPATATGGAFVSGILQDDASGTVELVEAGPSLALSLPAGGSPHRTPGTALSLRMAWRFKIAGSADNRDSLTVTLSWRF